MPEKGKAKSCLYLIAGTDIGGAEMLALNVSKAASNQFVFVTGRTGVLAGRFQAADNPFFIARRRYPIDPSYILSVFRISKKHQTDVYHAHSLLEALNAIVLAFFTRKKVFLTYHGFNYFDGPEVVNQIALLFLKRLSGHFFVSRQLQNFYLERYPGKIKKCSVVYNGLPEFPVEEYDHSSLRNEFKIPPGHLVLGMVGNFCEARDHLLVVKAFHLLVNSEIKHTVHLIFIGKQDQGSLPYFSEVSSFVNDNGLSDVVHFAGQRQDARKYLKNFDIFVYAAHRETFCLSMVEAIIAGIPVVVNDFPVLTEICRNGELAHIYKSGDESDLALKVRQVMDNLEAERRKASNNASEAQELYSMERHLQTLWRLYGEEK